MSDELDMPASVVADSSYCAWLVEVVFTHTERNEPAPVAVEIDGEYYQKTALYAALLKSIALVEHVEAQYANELYCSRLARMVFAPTGVDGPTPIEVTIEGKSHTRDELYAALVNNARLRKLITKKHAEEMYCERLVELVFPPVGIRERALAFVEIARKSYTKNELYAALLLSSELQEAIAERYHYYSDEMYCERLLKRIFPAGKSAASDTVKIHRKIYHKVELRRSLREDEKLREFAARKYKYYRSQWWLEMYCERLVEVAFPEKVEIEKRVFDKEELGLALDTDADLRRKVADGYHGDPKSTTETLLDKVFPMKVQIGDATYTKKKLRESLPDDPKLQQRTAAKTYLVPSKWLVEREMRARRIWSGDAADGDVYKLAAEKGLTGVCFSGGGIRSATFNLGVLQGLAQLKLLPQIDYLSSVSGGGYIHEFLAGWILRNGNRSSVIKELIPQAEPGCLPRAPEPIQWLKRYASYLTPARGPFSTDTWTAAAIWLRNTILNQIPILTAFACGFYLVHLLVPRPIEDWHPGFWERGVGGWLGWKVSGLALFLYALASVCILGRNLYLQERRARSGEDLASKLLTNGAVVGWVILPWLGCSLWMSYWVQMHVADKSLHYWGPVAVPSLLILAMVELVIFAGGSVRAYQRLNPDAMWFRTGLAGLGFALAGIVAAMFAVVLGWTTMEATRVGSVALSKWIQTYSASKDVPGMVIDTWRIRLTMLPGLLLSVPYVAIELTVGLLGRDYWGMRREWLARLRAWSMLYALLWSGVVSLVLLGPYVGYYIKGKGMTWVWSTLIAFVVSHGATIFAGWSGKADGKPTDKGIFGFKPLDLLAMVAAPIAIVTLLVGLSFVTSVGVDKLTYWLAECPLSFGPEWLPFVAMDVSCLVAAAFVAWLLGWRVDINEFSMHSFYRNRLSRCYLGATVPGQREADPFTGFDERSKMRALTGEMREIPPHVRDLLPIGYRTATGRVGRYDGPFPIFCSTLNLTTGEDLATQERKGTSFAFTPMYSGYSVNWTDGQKEENVSYNGYVPTEEYAYREGGIRLDSAVAISGAALNPNQGYNSNPALAFLMTFFNVRLGWWISNPRKTDAWPATTGRSTPRFALLHLFKELFGMVGDATKYVNLSDGGHFENMGLYELVRRRCTFIIVCDAEADPDMKFEGMGAAITKCRADFGAEIDLDLRPLQIQKDTGYSKAHCVVGTIQYPPPPGVGGKADASTECGCLGEKGDDPYTGVIVYMKSSLVGDEPADLLTHQLKYSVFPQDSTSNQWFTETLFEAYRRLGHHVALTAIQPALSPEKTEVKQREDIPELFNRMYAIWYPRTPEMDKYLVDHLKQLEGILNELRQRKELLGLEERLNDKTPWNGAKTIAWDAPQGDAQGSLYPIQFANSLLIFMYTVYTNLQLAFPDNRVSPHAEWWICLFRRWCRVTLVREAWKDHAQICPEEFRLFVRRELKLPEVEDYVE